MGTSVGAPTLGLVTVRFAKGGEIALNVGGVGVVGSGTVASAAAAKERRVLRIVDHAFATVVITTAKLAGLASEVRPESGVEALRCVGAVSKASASREAAAIADEIFAYGEP